MTLGANYSDENELVFASHAGEALAAVHRPIGLRLERHLGLSAAGCTNSRKILARTTGGVLTGITAGFASLGLVYETLGSIKFLLAGGEYKFSATFFADESLVFVHLIYLALDNKIFRPLTDLNRRL